MRAILAAVGLLIPAGSAGPGSDLGSGDLDPLRPARLTQEGNIHGIPDPRNQLVKAVSEMARVDYYVRGRGEKFSWRDVLKSWRKRKGPHFFSAAAQSRAIVRPL